MRSLYQVQNRDSYRYTSGINFVSLICFLLGIGAYFLVYDPIAYWPRNELFMFTTASGLNAIVAGGSYYLLSRVPAIRSYLMRDRTEPSLQRDSQ
jgi:cytosine/uracil/thiamine/allantoin permease